MHREFSPLDRTLRPESHVGLILTTLAVGVLTLLDLWPGLAGWLNPALGLNLPLGSGTVFIAGNPVRFAALAAILGGIRVLYISLESLLAGKLGADLALALAVLAALWIGQPLTAAEVVFIGLVGECLEAFTFSRTQRAVRKLVETTPRRCIALRDGGEVILPVEEVRPGERVLVRPGKRVPVDGVVVDGRSAVDQAMLTGESLPVDKTVGDAVYAGTMNQFGALIVEVRETAGETVIGRVVEWTVQALQEKSAGQRTADRLARYFLPVVLAVAAATFFFQLWWLRGDGDGRGVWQAALYPALAVLVVSCPCALILATPAAVIAAVGRLAGTGVLIKGGPALERLAEVDAFAFDKTGTSLKVGRNWA